MATSLCGQQVGANVGAVACDFLRGNVKILIVGGATFTGSDYVDTATMDAALVAKFKLATGNSQKLFPFPLVIGATDNTEAAAFSNSGYGVRYKTKGSIPAYTFQVVAGSTLEKKLKVYDGQNVPILILDDKKQIWGVKNGTTFQGAVYQLSIEPHGFGDGSNPKFTEISISVVDPADFSDNAFVYQTAMGTGSFKGLTDAELWEISHTTNVYKIGFRIPVAGLNKDLNPYDEYGALLSPLTFTAGTGVNYATPLVITSVAVDATLKALTVTFDSTSYTALPALTKIKLSAPIPATLDAAGIVNIEIASVILTK